MNTQMPLSNYTDRELVLLVDNLPNATPMETELANRLDNVLHAIDAPSVPSTIDWSKK